MSVFTKAKNFNVSNVSYGTPKVSDRGNKTISLLYNGAPLVLQFPLMLTWGLNERVDDNSGRVSYDYSLQFQSGKKNIDTFLNKMKELQDKLYDDAVANSKEWFGKTKMSREVAEAQCWPILKYPKIENSDESDYSRSPTLKVKVPFWNGKFNIELFDMNGNPLYLSPRDGQDVSELPQGDKTPMNFIPKGTHMSGLIKSGGIWYAGGRWGVTWKLAQAKCRAPVYLVGSGKCQIEDDSDDEEYEQDLDRKDEEELKKNDVPAYGGGDDDDEEDEENEENEEETHQSDDETKNDESEEEEEEEEEVPPPVVEEKPKKVRKRRVVKKKTKA